MKATNEKYDFDKSLQRIDDILNSADNQFEYKKTMPSRDSLTYTNGFYVNCTVLFIDICDSSKLTSFQNRPVLAKIYRSFISEMVALLNSPASCREVSINGDCVWGVYDTPLQVNVNEIFDLSAKACSLVGILNYKLSKKKYKTYDVGVGLDYGRALMIQAGYSGSKINDVLWMGDVVNTACHLCNNANQTSFDKRVFLTKNIYDNLSENNKKLCSWNGIRSVYQADIVNINMNNWLKQQDNA